MKVISICQHCSGTGRKKVLLFFSYNCQHCNGRGKRVAKINDFSAKYKSF